MVGYHQLVLVQIEDYVSVAEVLGLSVGPCGMQEVYSVGRHGPCVGIHVECTLFGGGHAVHVCGGRELGAALEREGHLGLQVIFGIAYIGVAGFPPGLASEIGVRGGWVEAGIVALFLAVVAVVGHPGLGVAAATGQVLPHLAGDEIGAHVLDIECVGLTHYEAASGDDAEGYGLFARESAFQVKFRFLRLALAMLPVNLVVGRHQALEVYQIRVLGVRSDREGHALYQVVGAYIRCIQLIFVGA